jgi:hypothetical protein
VDAVALEMAGVGPPSPRAAHDPLGQLPSFAAYGGLVPVDDGDGQDDGTMHQLLSSAMESEAQAESSMLLDTVEQVAEPTPKSAGAAARRRVSMNRIKSGKERRVLTWTLTRNEQRLLEDLTVTELLM